MKKFLSVASIFCLILTLNGVSAYAVENKPSFEQSEDKVIIGGYDGLLSDCSVDEEAADSESEPISEQSENKVIIGGYDGLLSDCSVDEEAADSESEPISEQSENKVIIGGYDGLLSDCSVDEETADSESEPISEQSEDKVIIGGYDGLLSDCSVDEEAADSESESISEQSEDKVIIGGYDGLLSDCSVDEEAADSESEPISEQSEDKVIIGGYDGLLSDCLVTNMPSVLSEYANVRVKSYATYDSANGVQVKVKLYVPLYSSPKPQFTGMSGTVTTKVGNTTKNKSFSKLANGTATIEKDVNTGVKGKRGDTGKVSVNGTATANNALEGGGAFKISYDITIP